MKTLYVNRPLLNSDDVIKWAKKQGFEKTLKPDDMHVTIAYSKAKVDWDKLPKEDRKEIVAKQSIKRTVIPLGDKGAIVLKFPSEDLHGRWRQLCDGGCSWDYPGYQSHVTITYNGFDGDLSKVTPYTGNLVFGPEVWEKLDEDWSAKES